jgi:hypothetical protein
MSGLRVLSFNLVQRYRGKEVDPRSVGRELDVPSILYGRITKVPGDESSIIVNLELVNTSDGSQRWGMERTVKTLEHSLLVNEIVTSVSNSIGLSLTGDEKKKQDAEALYVKGVTPEQEENVISSRRSLFKQAVDLNPDMLRPMRAWLIATTCSAYGGRAPTESFRRARGGRHPDARRQTCRGHAARLWLSW